MLLRIICFSIQMFLVTNNLGCYLQTQNSQTNSIQNDFLDDQSKIDVEAERYAVYSTLLKDSNYSMQLESNESRIVIIKEKTIACGKINEFNALHNEMEKIVVSILKLKPDLVESYDSENKSCYQLDNKLNLQAKYIFVSDDKLQSIFSDKEVSGGWESFYKEYPNSTGIISFSNVGFSKDGNQAFLYIEKSCGSLCAAGDFVLLLKEAGIWKVKARKNVWVS